MINQNETDHLKENKTDTNNEYTGGHSSSFPFLGSLGSTQKRYVCEIVQKYRYILWFDARYKV